MPRPTPRMATHRNVQDGIAYELWLPDADPPWPGVVILHGAGSCKENHADFARAAVARGWAALSFDARGHGASGGALSGSATTEVLEMASLLGGTKGVDPARIALRGSSMGGYMALHAAVAPAVAGVIAVCPASESQLLRGLRKGEFSMRVERESLEAWLLEHDLRAAIEQMGAKPLILLHAKGDEEIPYAQSEELYERAAEPKKLVIVPGGNHRSVQHDRELQEVGLAWLERNGLGP